jgi:hypothetical protein
MGFNSGLKGLNTETIINLREEPLHILTLVDKEL